MLHGWQNIRKGRVQHAQCTQMLLSARKCCLTCILCYNAQSFANVEIGSDKICDHFFKPKRKIQNIITMEYKSDQNCLEDNVRPVCVCVCVCVGGGLWLAS